MYKRILVPLDGSDNAYYALEHAIALAKVFDSQLFLLNVIDVNRFGVYSPDVFTSAAPDMMSFDQARIKLQPTSCTPKQFGKLGYPK